MIGGRIVRGSTSTAKSAASFPFPRFRYSSHAGSPQPVDFYEGFAAQSTVHCVLSPTKTMLIALCRSTTPSDQVGEEGKAKSTYRDEVDESTVAHGRRTAALASRGPTGKIRLAEARTWRRRVGEKRGDSSCTAYGPWCGKGTAEDCRLHVYACNPSKGDLSLCFRNLPSFARPPRHDGWGQGGPVTVSDFRTSAKNI